MRPVWLCIPIILSAGCLSTLLPDAGDSGPTHWEYDTEASMAPDFSGSNGTYPILLIHEHRIASPREQEDQRRNPVTCLTMAGGAIEVPPATSGPTTATAACPGPAADPATGRVFAATSALADAHAEALAVRVGSCGGGIVFLGRDTRSFLVREQEHDFTVAYLANRTFSVDGRWIAPGSALKIGYYVHYGSTDDQSFVRVVFDHPGEWREDRIAPYFSAIDGGNPPRPERGSGLVLDVPLSPASLRAPLEAATHATPGRVTGVLGLRMVHDGARLTEVTLRLATDHGVTTWYGAGRTAGALRLLGAEQAEREKGAVSAADVVKAFDMPWSALRGDGRAGLTDVRLQSNVSWTSQGGPLVAVNPPPQIGPLAACSDPCVFAFVASPGQGTSWQRVALPQEEPAAGALTLKVVAWNDTAGAARWWFVPQ